MGHGACVGLKDEDEDWGAVVEVNDELLLKKIDVSRGALARLAIA